MATKIFKPLRFLVFFSPWYWLQPKKLNRAIRIRCCLEELGPLFVKFGQILSTRQDLLPPDIAVELAKLQDQVPPFSSAIAIEIIEKAFAKKIDQIFLEFDHTPLASASIAQVHSARLYNGQEVVVKVVRPNIEAIIREDVAILETMANLADKYWEDGRRLKPKEVVAEYKQTILDELDLLMEAANGSLLRRNFEHSDLLYIPEIYWDYTKKNVMVTERIYGISISDIDNIIKHHIDLKTLAEVGVEIFYTQVFKHSYFHADMHPGNIFASKTPEKYHYIAVDFGIMGTLSPSDRNYLAENFIAFFNRDYRRVAELHVESCWVPKNTSVNQFESAIRTVCEPIFERPLKEISFGLLLLRLFQTARRFNMEIQPQLVLLQKTFLNIEGIGRQLYPDLDLWQTAKPFLERWMSEQVGLRALFTGFKENLPLWMEKLPNTPLIAYDVLAKLNQGKLQIIQDNPELKLLTQQIKENQQQTNKTILGSCLLVCACLLIGQLNTGFSLPLSGIIILLVVGLFFIYRGISD